MEPLIFTQKAPWLEAHGYQPKVTEERNNCVGKHCRSQPVFGFLSNKRADRELRDAQGRTALKRARELGSEDIITLDS